MAKVARGRISGLHGMNTYTADELRWWSDTYAGVARTGVWPDDPRWLRRWARQIGCVADRKVRAREHKAACRRRMARKPHDKTTLSYSGFGVERVVSGAD